MLEFNCVEFVEEMMYGDLVKKKPAKITGAERQVPGEVTVLGGLGVLLAVAHRGSGGRQERSRRKQGRPRTTAGAPRCHGAQGVGKIGPPSGSVQT